MSSVSIRTKLTFISVFLILNLPASSALAEQARVNTESVHEETPRNIDHLSKTNPTVSPVFHTSSSGIANRREQGNSIEEDTKNHENHRYHVATVDFPHVSIPYIISAWILIAGLAKIGFHVTPKIGLICPESCILIVVGAIIGLLLFYTGLERVGPLTPNVFFLYMLPPIILDAGYFMPNRLFFDNMTSILLYAVVGTVWNALTIGFSLWGVGLTGLYGVDMPLLDTLLFSSIVSAVDPVAVLAVFEEIHVNEVLYILVFGESLLNDAVTVVLYHMFEGYTEMGQKNILPIDYLAGVLSFIVASLGGALLGVVWGILAAFLSRFTHHVLIIEPLFVFVLGYLSYLTAELFHLSGIVALTFCGMTMKNYVEENISYKSHITLKYTMKMLANTSETIIFLFLGASTVNENHDWNTWFVIMTILFCSVYRSIGVLIQTWMLNFFRLHKINKVEQFIMAYGGLRGAVAFALVLVVSEKYIPSKSMMVTTIIVVVYFTVFLQGMTIGPLVRFLNVATSNKTKPSMNERLHTRLIDHLMAGIEDIAGHLIGNYHLRDKFKHYNNKFIRPLLTRDHHVKEPKIFETYSKLNLTDAMNLVKQNNIMGSVTRIDQKISLSSLIRSYTQSNLPRYSDGSVLSSQGVTSQSESSFVNLDMGELAYSPSYKDLADAQLHHILSDSMFKPPRRLHRYSRDVIDETTPHPPFHHKTRMQIRHILNDKKSKKRKGYHHNNVRNDYICNGKGPKSQKYSRQKKQNTDSNSRKTTSLRFTLPASISEISEVENYSHQNQEMVLDDDDNPLFGTVFSPDDNGITFTARMTPPENDTHKRDTATMPLSCTITETTLPWKRDENCTDGCCVWKQQEFPPWVDNKEYHVYTSLTNTFMGKISSDADTKTPDVFTVFGLEKPIQEDTKNENINTVNKFIVSQTDNIGAESVLPKEEDSANLEIENVETANRFINRQLYNTGAESALSGEYSFYHVHPKESEEFVSKNQKAENKVDVSIEMQDKLAKVPQMLNSWQESQAFVINLSDEEIMSERL
ncbi:sodium/hydrogen exchanger 3-like isoform X2 [Limulus polyphemus]|uniref:Sodium/hydrogen exchanger n=1 Tax=Limulus polyphemus TaxID=6850 RepID=A0ABM1SRD6_LIMPO|nr:sodium/hydrogen exchanger 3-like isoform X2 [Limulus polyphemus]